MKNMNHPLKQPRPYGEKYGDIYLYDLPKIRFQVFVVIVNGFGWHQRFNPRLKFTTLLFYY